MISRFMLCSTFHFHHVAGDMADTSIKPGEVVSDIHTLLAEL